MTVPSDGARLPEPLHARDSEHAWFALEGTGSGRRLGILVWLTRTGPRTRLGLGPGIIEVAGIPLPSPFRLERETAPLLLAGVYDLDAGTAPIVRELPVSSFDTATFSGRTRGGEIACERVTRWHLRAELPELGFDLALTPMKAPVGFGPGGSPRIVQGPITTSWVQRPRIEFTGSVRIGSELIRDVRGEGCEDRQWLRVPPAQVKWTWIQVRFPDDRELVGYAMRESNGRFGRVDEGTLVGTAGWFTERDGSVAPVDGFSIREDDETAWATDRARVPSRLVVRAASDELVIRYLPRMAPYIPLGAFGPYLDGGIWEGPASVEGHSDARAWVEYMNTTHVRLG